MEGRVSSAAGDAGLDRYAALTAVAIRRSGRAIRACIANITTVPAGHPIRDGREAPPPLPPAPREPMTDLSFFGASFASGLVIFLGMIV